MVKGTLDTSKHDEYKPHHRAKTDDCKDTLREILGGTIGCHQQRVDKVAPIAKALAEARLNGLPSTQATKYDKDKGQERYGRKKGVEREGCTIDKGAMQLTATNSII